MRKHVVQFCCIAIIAWLYTVIIWIHIIGAIEGKPNFDLSSLNFTISIPVHDDIGKFPHSCKDTKMASPQ